MKDAGLEGRTEEPELMGQPEGGSVGLPAGEVGVEGFGFLHHVELQELQQIRPPSVEELQRWAVTGML